MNVECPHCLYRTARWETDSAVGEPIRLVVTCGRCHHEEEFVGDAAAAYLEAYDLELPER